LAVNTKPTIAGTIKFDRLELESLVTKKKLDIKPIVLEMSIFESMAQPFVTAEFVIEESLSLVSRFPIVGQEHIHVTYDVGDPNFRKKMDRTFRVYSIQEMQMVNARTVHYVLRCVSLSTYKDWLTTIRKSYPDMPISDMANKVYDNFISTDRKLEVGKTEGSRTLVIPNMAPARAMRFLAQYAKSDKYEPSNFLFFENNDSFHFKTVEEFLSKKAQDIYTTKEKQNYVGKEQNTSSRSPSSKQQKPAEWRKITHLRWIRVFDNEITARRGGFGNRVFTINPNISLFSEKRFSYTEHFNKLNHTTQGKAGQFLTDEADLLNSDGFVRQAMLFSNAGQEGHPSELDQRPDFFQYLIGANALLDNMVLNLIIPGDNERRAGDIIALNIPEYTATDDYIDKKNKTLSGSYLVTSVRHLYAQNKEYSCVIQCIKNCYEQDPDDEKLRSQPAPSSTPTQVEPKYDDPNVAQSSVGIRGNN
jgi:hypothetical protein